MTISQAAASRVLIAAHRGVAGGNIPCNSIPGFKAALNQGFNIIQTDWPLALKAYLNRK